MKYQILQQNVLCSGVSKHIVLVTSDAFYMLKKPQLPGANCPWTPPGALSGPWTPGRFSGIFSKQQYQACSIP